MFMEKICRKCAPETGSRPLYDFYIYNYIYSQYIQKNLLEIRYFERGLLKILKKINLIFVFKIYLFLWKSL